MWSMGCGKGCWQNKPVMGTYHQWTCGTWCELLDLARLWYEVRLVNGHRDTQTAQPLSVVAGGNTFRAWAGERSMISWREGIVCYRNCAQREDFLHYIKSRILKTTTSDFALGSSCLPMSLDMSQLLPATGTSMNMCHGITKLHEKHLSASTEPALGPSLPLVLPFTIWKTAYMWWKGWWGGELTFIWNWEEYGL